MPTDGAPKAQAAAPAASRWAYLVGRAASRVATRSSRAKVTGRWLVALIAAAAFVLALVGLRQWDLGSPEVSLSAGAVVAGALALFGIGGVPPLAVDDTVPLAWDLARLLAPLATAGAVVGVFVTFGDERLHRVAARHAQGHLLLIGPAHRVVGYRDALESATVVHSTVDGQPLATGVVRASITPAVDGWKPLGAARARTIVVATGDDELNLALCASVWDLLDAHPHLEALVEIDDQATALRLVTALAANDPTRRLDVICRSDLIVERALDLMLPPSAGERTVMIAGDGPLVGPVAAGVADHLWMQMQLRGVERRRIALMPLADGRSEAPLRGLSDAATFETRVFASLDGFLAWDERDVSAFVDCEDPADTRRVALELNDERPGSMVCVPSAGAQLPLGLVPLDRSAAARAGRSAGVWGRAVAELWPSVCDGHDDQGPFLNATDQFRAAVAAIASSERWRLVASHGDGYRETFFSVADLDDLGLTVDFRGLPLALERSGLVVECTEGNVKEDPIAPLPTSMIDDGLIEAFAQQIHSNYLESIRPEQADLDANCPWQDLTDQQRANNRQQARQNLVRLAKLHLEVVEGPEPGRELVHGLEEEVIERLARTEHDRWSRQRYAQGYRYGRSRCEDCSPKTHPDLVAWEDLTEPTRDKDRNPVRRIIPNLEAIGLAVVASNDNDPTADNTDVDNVSDSRP